MVMTDGVGSGEHDGDDNDKSMRMRMRELRVHWRSNNRCYFGGGHIRVRQREECTRL